VREVEEVKGGGAETGSDGSKVNRSQMGTGRSAATVNPPLELLRAPPHPSAEPKHRTSTRDAERRAGLPLPMAVVAFRVMNRRPSQMNGRTSSEKSRRR
jgi:hypothetical protein